MSRRARLFLAALAALLLALALPASAQASDSGWFENDAVDGAPPADTPALAESPLLAEGDANAEAIDRDPAALTHFKPYLDPYGKWRDDPTYGRVWIPAPSVVGPGFQPYVTNGRWALDQDSEWVWVSDYPFGWVVFHYGRWVWIADTGWAWIPGLRYAPAWVVWRVPSGPVAYVGWAPAPPSFVWFGGYAVYWGYDPYYTWVFCPSHHLFAYHVHYHVVRDHYWMTYAARHTRHYVPAAPHRVPAQPRRRDAHPAVSPGSPTLEAARIPSSAVPRERIRGAALSDPRLPKPSSRTPSRLEPSRLFRDRRELGPHVVSPRPSRGVETYESRPLPPRAPEPVVVTPPGNEPAPAVKPLRPQRLKPVSKPRPLRDLRPAKPSPRLRDRNLAPSGNRRLKR